MSLSKSGIQWCGALIVPVFLFLQLLERLYVFSAILSPVYLAVVPFIFFVVFVKDSLDGPGVQLPHRSLVFFLALVICLFIVLVAQHAFLFDFYDANGRSALGFSWLTGTYAITWGLIGLSLSAVRFTSSNLCALAIMSGVALLVLPNMASGYVNLTALREDTGIENLSHLWISENIVVLFFLSYALASNYLLRFLLLAAVAVFLVGMLGRSSLFFALAAVAFYEVIFSPGRVPAKIIIGVAVFFLSIFVLLGMREYFDDPMLDKVLFKGGLQADASYGARSEILRLGLSYLDKQLWIGDPTILANEIGSVGAYIHNLLSAWQLYGFPFFVFLILFILCALFKMLYFRFSVGDEPILILGALLLIYSVMSVLAAKHAGFWILWLSLGLWGGFKFAIGGQTIWCHVKIPLFEGARRKGVGGG